MTHRQRRSDEESSSTSVIKLEVNIHTALTLKKITTFGPKNLVKLYIYVNIDEMRIFRTLGTVTETFV